ncbi:cupin domain-containing protein [Nocardia colli]|uniref:Cupin domain-containing protein n=1 Tax=Nocardia colli TaxID=2545717 RepID=A0A5N0DN16_9NOCA|nr:cupin domain-containing protein [Nocardia colli]KAA8877309.1 cupin domain-containing protein [Nocardia colli]
MEVRRVVTGHDQNGRAVVVSDSEIDGFRPSLMPGFELHRLWGGDYAPHFPDDGAQSKIESHFPPVGGFRFGIFSIAPSDRREAPPGADQLASGLAELEAGMPGLFEHMEPDAPGMHRTATIDFEIVLDGEVWLELDDGATVHLRRGDAVVQNGTRHAWHNRGTDTCRLALFICGAQHDHVPGHEDAGQASQSPSAVVAATSRNRSRSRNF